jgi:nicotinic acid phosphoribosyltransferase
MIQAYLESGQTETAVFEFFVRKLPPQRSFLMAAGLEQALEFLENLRFSADELEWLEKSGRFSPGLIDFLANFRFSGDVHAMPEGTAFFQNEPILRVTAPLAEAQLVETRLINILHYQTLIASKAARMVRLAPGKLLVDFGLRRAHGADAGLMAARASYIAGFAGTATLLAEKAFGIPTYGTMAHSFVQSFDDEMAAFEAFARARPRNLTLLIDTYDTTAAARKVVALAPRLRELGIAVRAVRIDSGDLAALARSVRGILDDGGLRDTGIFASGGIDEETLVGFARSRFNFISPVPMPAGPSPGAAPFVLPWLIGTFSLCSRSLLSSWHAVFPLNAPTGSVSALSTSSQVCSSPSSMCSCAAPSPIGRPGEPPSRGHKSSMPSSQKRFISICGSTGSSSRLATLSITTSASTNANSAPPNSKAASPRPASRLCKAR